MSPPPSLSPSKCPPPAPPLGSTVLGHNKTGLIGRVDGQDGRGRTWTDGKDVDGWDGRGRTGRTRTDGTDMDGRDGRGRTGRTGRTWTDGTDGYEI